jgi:hypothetical protein
LVVDHRCKDIKRFNGRENKAELEQEHAEADYMTESLLQRKSNGPKKIG